MKVKKVKRVEGRNEKLKGVVVVAEKSRY